MNLYEHTIIARQDTSPSELKLLTEKYSKIVEKISINEIKKLFDFNYHTKRINVIYKRSLKK